MQRSVKVFRNGANLAVRFPVDFQIRSDRLYIRQQENGDIILSHRPEHDAEAMFALLENLNTDTDFLGEQERITADLRDPFAENTP